MSELWHCLILLGVLEVFWFYTTLIIFVDNNNNNNNTNWNWKIKKITNCNCTITGITLHSGTIIQQSIVDYVISVCGTVKTNMMLTWSSVQAGYSIEITGSISPTQSTRANSSNKREQSFLHTQTHSHNHTAIFSYFVSLRFIAAAIFTALHEMQTRSSDENSVRLSVCRSDAWFLTKWKKDRSRFLYHTKEHLA